MPSTFSQSLRIELIGSGEQSGVWGVTTNNNLGSLIEQAISGNTPLDVTLGNITLTALNGVVDQSRSAVLSVSGTPGTTRVITIPNVTKLYTVRNTSDSTVQIKTATGAAYSVPAAAQANIFCDGNNVITGRTITDGAQTLLNTQTPFNNAALTGVPTAPTAAVGTNTTQIATTAFVQAALPAGVIVMWSGSIVSIPTGWALCNGAGGTPDLRDRFVVGAGNSYAVGNTGGSNTVTLTTSNIPSHTHSISGSGTTSGQSNDHTHSGTTAATNVDHTHSGSGTTSLENTNHTHSGSGTTANVDINHSHNGSGTTSGESADHVHSGSTASENVNHTHSFSGTVDTTDINHTHYFSTNTASSGNHSHQISSPDGFGAGGGGNPDAVFDPAGGYINGSTRDAGTHSHFVDGNTGFMNQNATHNHTYGGTTGGISNNHQHAFTTGGVSANHTHNFSFTSGAMNSNNVHAHTYSFTTGGVSANHAHTYSFTTAGMNSNTTHTHTITTGGVSAGHTHTFSFSGTSGAEGGGTAHENRPPYYALAYIMKL